MNTLCCSVSAAPFSRSLQSPPLRGQSGAPSQGQAPVLPPFQSLPWDPLRELQVFSTGCLSSPLPNYLLRQLAAGCLPSGALQLPISAAQLQLPVGPCYPW